MKLDYTIRGKWLAVLCLACGFAAMSGPAVAEDGWKSLFNGKDLTGWDGNPELWSVKDGVILGVTTGPEQLKYNQFLIWRGGIVKNFELRATVRQNGNNSGIQYRSKELKEVGPWSLSGYQCDIHPSPAYGGMLYDERGRGILVQNGQSIVVDEQGKKFLVRQKDPLAIDNAQWHEYTVVACANKATHKIDGQVVMELTDHDAAKRSLEGVLGFQIHRGPAMKVEIKDVQLKVLPGAPLVTLAQEPIPSDAKLLESPAKPRGKGPGGTEKK